MGMEEPAAEPPFSSLGYSMGHWDGEELVVTTSNIDWPYYAEIGTPQSTQARYKVGGQTSMISIEATGPQHVDSPLVQSTAKQ